MGGWVPAAVLSLESGLQETRTTLFPPQYTHTHLHTHLHTHTHPHTHNPSCCTHNTEVSATELNQAQVRGEEVCDNYTVQR